MPTSLLLVMAVATGVASGVFLDPAVSVVAPWLIAGASLITIVFRSSAGVARTGGALAIGGAACLIGAAANARAVHPPLRSLVEDRLANDTPTLIEGRVLQDATPSETGAGLLLRVDRAWTGSIAEATSGGVSLSIGGSLAAAQAAEWRAGRVLRMPAILRRPARYLDVGVPDQERLLARRGIALVGTVKSAALVDVVKRGWWFDEAAARARGFARRSIQHHVGARDSQAGAIATAILIGDRGALDASVERRLQEAGTYHVIAISGGNIAILAGLVIGALWWVGLRDHIGAAAAIIVLVAYAFLTGGGASVMRATMMAAIYLSLRLIDQRTPPLQAMAITAAALLIVSPLSIGDVGFWLTFGATAAIIVGAGRVVLPQAAWLRNPLALVLASACAEVVLMPLGALIFQRVTLAGLVVNLAAVPCMAVVQIAAMGTVAADGVGLARLAGAAGWVTRISADGLVQSAALVDLAPWLVWRVPPPGLALVAAYYVALVAWLRTRGRFALIAAVASFLWIAVAPATLARVHGDGQLHLTMMDVGQGDAMLVTLPNGRTLMVDAGGVSMRGDFDIGDRVLGPAIRARGVGRLDYLAVTHGDPDHIGGAASLTRDFSPLELWEGTPVPRHEPTRVLHDTATLGRSSWRTLQRGDRIEAGGVELRIHHPAPPDWERQKVRNDDSLVIEIRFGQVSMLLTGDIEREGEQALIPALDLLPIVVLKAPHHGSGTSSTEAFLSAVKPDIVLISCGRGNPYGHPVPYVLDRYRSMRAEIFRTDQDGQIEVVTDGRSVGIHTFTGRTFALTR
ncbi:MAG: DNA internalization-related competence protein ComEC/Rec2 [Vicinamibacterales bacterium]